MFIVTDLATVTPIVLELSVPNYCNNRMDPVLVATNEVNSVA